MSTNPGTSTNRAADYVEGDTGPALVMDRGEDVTDYLVTRLHIRYKPYILSIDAVRPIDAVNTFYFDFTKRFTAQLINPVAAGASSIDVLLDDGVDFADLPDSGELVIDGEHVLYTAKSGVAMLVLATPLVYGYDAGQALQRAPDLRPGTWETIVETINEDGQRLSFPGLSLRIDRGMP